MHTKEPFHDHLQLVGAHGWCYWILCILQYYSIRNAPGISISFPVLPFIAVQLARCCLPFPICRKVNFPVVFDLSFRQAAWRVLSLVEPPVRWTPLGFRHGFHGIVVPHALVNASVNCVLSFIYCWLCLEEEALVLPPP